MQRLVSRQGGKVVSVSGEKDQAEWVRRIIAGDADAEAELVRRYQEGISVIIGRVVHNDAVTEDLSQETFRIALEKIRKGDLRDPERISGFICGVARNLAIDYIRKMRRAAGQEETGEAEQIRDPQPDPYERLWRKERAQLMREMINELEVERDREVLSRYYLAEEDKAQICADLGMSSQHFNTVISRALKRYRKLYLKRFGKS